MLEAVKLSSIFFLVAVVAIAGVILFVVLDYFGTRQLIISYCNSNGFKYEERLYHGFWRGYCIFEGVDCYGHECFPGGNCLQAFNETGVVYNISECLAAEYYLGSCTPCMFPVHDCSGFEDVEVCSQEVTPVCARIRVGVVEPFTIHERSIGNACTACINSKLTEKVISYTNRSCESKVLE